MNPVPITVSIAAMVLCVAAQQPTWVIAAAFLLGGFVLGMEFGTSEWAHKSWRERQ